LAASVAVVDLASNAQWSWSLSESFGGLWLETTITGFALFIVLLVAREAVLVANITGKDFWDLAELGCWFDSLLWESV
jgi:hypothetical protein